MTFGVESNMLQEAAPAISFHPRQLGLTLGELVEILLAAAVWLFALRRAFARFSWDQLRFGLPTLMSILVIATAGFDINVHRWRPQLDGLIAFTMIGNLPALLVCAGAFELLDPPRPWTRILLAMPLTWITWYAIVRAFEWRADQHAPTTLSLR